MKTVYIYKALVWQPILGIGGRVNVCKGLKVPLSAS